ncbi:PEP/pyruvate-binding domain-containing protein [Nocardia paucivorans]|uniref:PEP/pyruvate-binding domain-containing protein n=1 Tax=Nocardia paucivorans TaxID=114259 RepID=UPI001FE16CD8|nr:PEP/pyruvate-binding domain-containing protein [Nocardia paucivorans]
MPEISKADTSPEHPIPRALSGRLEKGVLDGTAIGMEAGVQVLGPWSDAVSVATSGGRTSESLYTLQTAGLRVPEWAVLGTEVFAAFLTDVPSTVLDGGPERGKVSAVGGLDEWISTYARVPDSAAALAAAARIRAAIIDTELPESVRAVVVEAYQRVGGGAVAVRPSVVGEEDSDDSYAGVFDAFLDVDGVDAVLRRVRDCWASVFSERSVRYAFTRGRPPVTRIAVVLQRLVAARASGTVSTANPVTGTADESVISVVYGSGAEAVDADSVVVDAAGAVVRTAVGDRNVAYHPIGEDGVVTEKLLAERRGKPVLTDSEVGELVERARTAAARLGSPQEIEWALDVDGFWFPRTCPITASAAGSPGEVPPAVEVSLAPGRATGAPDSGATGPPAAVDRETVRRARIMGAGEDLSAGESRIWDDFPLVEGFDGTTSPLTFTTVADIHGRMYREYMASLGVPDEQLRQADDWTPHLFGYFHGRIYYNLLHWYRAMGIAPGGSLARRALAAMFGVPEPIPEDMAKTLRPFVFRNPFERFRIRAVVTATFIRRFFEIDVLMRRFRTDFHRVYDRFDAIEYRDAAQAYAVYRRVDRDLVRRWGPLLVLDAILLTCIGLLTRLFLPNIPTWPLLEPMGPDLDVESAEPTRALTALARTAHADPALVELLNTTDPRDGYRALREAGRTDFLAEIETYLDRYGHYAPMEPKLEVPDPREDPSVLFVMLRSALARVGEIECGLDSAGRRAAAPAYPDTHLRGIRRLLYDRLWAKTTRCIAYREQLRFCRARAFGTVRRIIRVMGRDLFERGIVDDPADVFYLTEAELRGCYEGASTDRLHELVTTRKALRTRDAELAAPARFTTVGPTFAWAESAAPGWVPTADIPAAPVGTVFTGTPSAAGVVEGMAVVSAEPRDAAGGILVAHRADPRWVAVLPSVSALVIERSGPLTHIAIVARELGVPTVVRVSGAVTRLRTGMRIRVDGGAGTVTVLSEGEHDRGI